MSIRLSKDPRDLRHLSPEDAIGFDPVEILRDGFCLIQGDDLALFEEKSAGVYFGHYFLTSRGKKAIEICESFLAYVFDDGAKVILGLTPIDNKAALWMTRRLGFTMLEIFETDLGLMQLSMKRKNK